MPWLAHGPNLKASVISTSQKLVFCRHLFPIYPADIAYSCALTWLRGAFSVQSLAYWFCFPAASTPSWVIQHGKSDTFFKVQHKNINLLSVQLTEYQFIPHICTCQRNRQLPASLWMKEAYTKGNHTDLNRPAHSVCEIMHAIINLPLRLDWCGIHDADNRAIIASGVAFTALPHYWNRC